MLLAFKRLQWFDKAKFVFWLLLTAFVAPPWLWLSTILMRLNMRILEDGFGFEAFFGTIFISFLSLLFIAGAVSPLYAAYYILRNPK